MSNRDFCDNNCNRCPLIQGKNSRQLTMILNKLFDKFGDGFMR